MRQVAAVAGREVVKIEIGDSGGGVGIDEDGVAAFIGAMHHGHARKLFHLTNHSLASVWPLAWLMSSPGGAG